MRDDHAPTAQATWQALTSPAGHRGFTACVTHCGPNDWRSVLAWFTGAGKGLGDVAYMEFREATAEAARARCLEAVAVSARLETAARERGAE